MDQRPVVALDTAVAVERASAMMVAVKNRDTIGSWGRNHKETEGTATSSHRCVRGC